MQKSILVANRVTIIILLLITITHSTQSFDWQNYINRYSYLKEAGITNWHDALNHYLDTGIKEGKTSVLPVPDTNFDWQYYVQTNKLTSISSQEQALEHYRNIGFFKQLSYCKKFTIAILLHLHDLKQVDNYIDKINNFMQINNLNNFYIKINIPLDTNIHEFKVPHSPSVTTTDIYTTLALHTPYYTKIITPQNSSPAYSLVQYLKTHLKIPENRLQIFFSENRGRDIGGFFLLLDQLITQNIYHDYIIKLHALEKQKNVVNNLLTSFLNIPINTLLHESNCVYSNKVWFNYTNLESGYNSKLVDELLTKFELPKRNFNFPAGSVFIVARQFTEFFKKHNLLTLYNSLNREEIAPDGLIEHAYERFFGYLIEHLQLTTKIIDYHAPSYIYDNRIEQDKNLPVIYNPEQVKKLIKKHNIQPMAIYFPQFHECEENNRFWSQGFTEWTLMNNYRGEIKKPHVDIGYYNMLEYTTRKKQAELAKSHGISAFCYYHYWFKDHKVMHQGIEKILEDGEPDMPFTLCWANESWTRNWDGLESQVLIAQDYGTEQDWIKHYEYLSQFFKHKNYIKEDNCPLIYIYRIEHISQHNALEMLALWKKLAIQDGFKDLKIISILGGFKNITHGLEKYVDGYAEHQPTFNMSLNLSLMFIDNLQVNVDAQKFYQNALDNKKISDNYTHGLFYSWDNSSRRINKQSVKFINLSYRAFENFLVKTIETISKTPNKYNNFILVNSWNEWTEQAMIEPNERDGYELLNIFKKYFT